jgi:hypothetical protein
VIALAGIDPVTFLTTEDSALMLAMQATATRVHEIRAEANKS